MDHRRLMALTDSDVTARMEDRGCDVLASSPAICGRFLASEIEKWAGVTRANGITTDG